MTKILIMGLPGSGKTTLSKKIVELLPDTHHLNGDAIRTQYNDWDFSIEGRLRQADRMRDLAKESYHSFVLNDFICPLPEMREKVNPDWIIWVDTIERGRFEDTNKTFVPPEKYDFRITEQDADKWAPFIVDHIVNKRRRPIFDWKKETVQQLGRWQPWHKGHRALFERLLQKTGQVVIMVRDCQGWNDSNPFNFNQVKNNIQRDLDPLYQGQYEIMLVPNIVHIGWGRGVGYTSGEEFFDEEITKISGTQIRKEMGLS
jgi:hypothetical protein